MDKETLNSAYATIENFRDKLGEVLVDLVMEEENAGLDMAKAVIGTFSMCQTKREFEIADAMLAAVCSWEFETLVEKIKEHDADETYFWESV